MASQWLNIKGENYFIETSVVLISVMLAFNHKKDAIKRNIRNILSLLFVHCTFEDWMWNYRNIKVYLKTLMLSVGLIAINFRKMCD